MHVRVCINVRFYLSRENIIFQINVNHRKEKSFDYNFCILKNISQKLIKLLFVCVLTYGE